MLLFFILLFILAIHSSSASHDDDFCSLPARYGNCSLSLTRWFYDSRTQKCRKFIYSGCDANDNNFLSYSSCLFACTTNTCSRSCGLAVRVGTCNLKLERWFFNTTTLKCERFIYSGCMGNSNNFDSELDCRTKCQVLASFCYLLPRQGGESCKNSSSSSINWYYDSISGKCKLFFYNGCNGNRNNFKTFQDCEHNCS